MSRKMRKVTKAKKSLDCPFDGCFKSFKASTTSEARAKRMTHVIKEHGQEESTTEGEINHEELEQIASVLVPEEDMADFEKDIQGVTDGNPVDEDVAQDHSPSE